MYDMYNFGLSNILHFCLVDRIQYNLEDLPILAA